MIKKFSERNFYHNQLKRGADEVFNKTVKEEKRLLMEASNTVLNFTWWFEANNHPTKKMMFGNIFWELIFKLSNYAEASFFLALNGFYNSANAELRTALDCLMTRTYFLAMNSLDGRGVYVPYENRFHPSGGTSRSVKHSRVEQEYHKWISKKKYTDLEGKEKNFPSQEDIILVLKKIPKIKELNKKQGILSEIRKLYKKLSTWSHSRPDKRDYNTTTGSASIFSARFNKVELKKWYESLQKIYDYFVLLSILIDPNLKETQYYVTFSKLNETLAKKIEEI